MTFQVGDKVIYPNHGLGVVQRIETKTILGTTCGFYQLRMVSNDTTVLVPVENADNVGLRKAVGDQEVERLFGLLGDGKIDTHQNWKGRFKDNSDRMRTGSIFDVVEVLKSLTYLARSKNLSFREKRMLDRAKFLVVSEISEVTHDEVPSVEQKVEHALERCFATKNRALTRQATVKPAAAAAKVSSVAESVSTRPPHAARVVVVETLAGRSQTFASAVPADVARLRNAGPLRQELGTRACTVLTQRALAFFVYAHIPFLRDRYPIFPFPFVRLRLRRSGRARASSSSSHR